MKPHIIILSAALTLAACEEKKPHTIEFIDPEAENALRNACVTTYGTCATATRDRMSLITDNGDTVDVDLSLARDNGAMMGGCATGDRMAAVSEQGAARPKTVVNISALMGDWTMPNPLDGSSIVGISIRDGGVAESIDQSTIIYRTWRLVDGRLEITLVREGGGDEEEVNLYDIMKLDNDSLVIGNDEDTFEYGRGGSGGGTL